MQIEFEYEKTRKRASNLPKNSDGITSLSKALILSSLNQLLQLGSFNNPEGRCSSFAARIPYKTFTGSHNELRNAVSTQSKHLRPCASKQNSKRKAALSVVHTTQRTSCLFFNPCSSRATGGLSAGVPGVKSCVADKGCFWCCSSTALPSSSR